MHSIYLDYNCFQRCFDDPRQVRIRMEALACEEIFAGAERGEIKLIWSFMHEDENLLCPFPERKIAVSRIASLCKAIIGPDKKIHGRAKSLQQEGRLSSKDAVHVACAEFAECGYFLTCDDELIKRSARLSLGLRIMNPVDYVRGSK